MTREQALATIEKAQGMIAELMKFAGPGSQLEAVVVMRVRYGDNDTQVDVNELTHCSNCTMEILEDAARLVKEDMATAAPLTILPANGRALC